MTQSPSRGIRTIPDLLHEAAEKHGACIAVEDARGSYDYGELENRVARLARVLREHAPAPSARVAVLAPNTRLFLECYFAAAMAGQILVPLNSRAHPTGLARLVAHSEASLLIVDPALADAGQELRDAAGGVTMLSGRGLETAAAAKPVERCRPDPADPAQIYYTSGTTGDPKGVVLTHENVCHHAVMARDALALADTDTFGHIAPLFHLADAWATFSVTLAGGRHRLVESFQPEGVLDALASGITITNLVPTMLGDLVRHPAARREYPALRLLLSGGAPITPGLVKRIQETFRCDYVQTYGLTETCPFLTMSILPPHLRAAPGDVQQIYRCKTGRALPGVEVRVVDDAGSPVPADGRTVGEIVARGPSVTPGYWRNPHATHLAFRDGWLLTGDLAVLDAQGFINIVDRKKDVILTGGETVYSTEVESVLASHPAVHEVAVLGVPHERWGEAVLAVIVRCAESRVTETELHRYARGHLGGHQVPKAFVFRPSLPRTGSGKTSKRLLRDEYAGWFAHPE